MEHIHVFRILYMYYRTYTCISDLIHVYYRTYTDLTELILVFWILYGYYRTYTCILDLTCILRNLYLSYGTYICVQDLFLSYRSYTCVKVPVGTMSRKRSGSYHLPGRIRLIQIRTLVFRRYRSQIHYTEVPVGTTGLILILQDLYLFSDTRVPVGTTKITQIQEYP